MHLIFAGYFRWPAPRQTPEVTTLANIRQVRIVRQTLAPRRRPAIARVVSRHARVAPPHIASQKTARGQSASIERAVARASIAPSPAATIATAGCMRPNGAPALASVPDTADIHAAARAARASGTAAIDVALGADGSVLETRIAQSSGNAGLDAAAERMARDASYSPRYAACKAVAGNYTFRVKFVAW